MKLGNFFQSSGEITFDSKFLSLRFIKEALEGNFKIVVQEETSKYLKCKIIRYMRLFGGPSFLPHPTLEVRFSNENENSKLHYTFISHDYTVLVIGLPIFIFIASLNGFFKNASVATTIFFAVLIVNSLAILADTKYFGRRIKKALSKI